ncbi:ABC transporter transmembrane domain-containing protein [Treponema pedis]|uniref:ABC transporter ATP-binding protein n=1 Tax=Treponema pedis TaxID=409322 RepID=A0A7S6WQB2_9SPIR|nr:ABC transporter ATP-binding protein [Treponema pedis]QOW61361.1 ABC transporter ATP-binding protein [Treponema pedis]
MTYQKRYFKLHLKVILLSVIPLALSTAIPLLLGKIIDNLNKGFSPEIIKTIIICFVIILVQRFFNFIGNYHFNITENIVAEAETGILFDEFLNSKSNLSGTFNNEKLLNRITYEPYKLGSLYGTTPVMLVENIIMFVVAFCVLLYLNVYLLILTSLFIPAIYSVGCLVRKNIIKCSKEKSLVTEKFLLRLTEVLTGFPDIKIFRAENKINASLKEIRRNMLKVEKTEAFYQRMYRDINGFLFTALPLITLVAGFIFMQYGKISLGTVISFYMYVGNFVEPAQNLADLRIGVLNAGEKKKLIDEIKKDFAVVLSGNENCNNFSDILLHEVKHKFENKDINVKANLNISTPGFYGISAPSGLGKSTALKILSGLLYSDTADVSVGGKRIKTFDTDSLNGKIFYVSAESFIFQGTVKENIELSDSSNITEEVFNSIFDKSDDISLQTNLETEGANISLGQRQRIVLLRLLALEEEPKIIILDEALSGLDEKRETSAIELLKKLFKNTIILFVTHRKKSFDLCDAVFEFTAG